MIIFIVSRIDQGECSICGYLKNCSFDICIFSHAGNHKITLMAAWFFYYSYFILLVKIEHTQHLFDVSFSICIFSSLKCKTNETKDPGL